MSNTYLQFSEMLELESPEELEWMERHLDIINRFDEHDDDSEFPQLDTIEYLRGMLDGNILTDGPVLDFRCEIEDIGDKGKALWIHTDESGNPDNVAAFVQYFFKEMRPDGYWSMTWAVTESKPLAGAFHGGAFFVTAKKIEWMNAWNWTGDRMDKAKAAAERKKKRYKAVKGNKKKGKK